MRDGAWTSNVQSIESEGEVPNLGLSNIKRHKVRNWFSSWSYKPVIENLAINLVHYVKASLPGMETRNVWTKLKRSHTWRFFQDYNRMEGTFHVQLSWRLIQALAYGLGIGNPIDDIFRHHLPKLRVVALIFKSLMPMPQVIITHTTYHNYAIHGYEHNVLDYYLSQSSLTMVSIIQPSNKAQVMKRFSDLKRIICFQRK